MIILKLKNQILHGKEITKQDANSLLTSDLDELCSTANEIRKHFCGNAFDICTIINGKSGRCSENCKYCAQSAHFKVNVDEYPLLSSNQLIEDAVYNHNKGILRYSIVTSGRYLSDEEIHDICENYKKISESCNISLCASHGLLSYDQFRKLKKAGVNRYHNNLETSSIYFPNICTTHTYEDKITTIKNAQRAGLEVCSGGIMGLGETMSDRIDMAFDLKDLGINSIPINILNPIKGTPFEHLPILKLDEVRRIISIFRFILPRAALRLAGGRGLLKDKGSSVFQSGANAAISGDMLTTLGIGIQDDIDMISNLGFEVRML